MKNHRSNLLVCSFLLTTTLLAQVPEPRSLSRTLQKDVVFPSADGSFAPTPGMLNNEEMKTPSYSLPALRVQPSATPGAAATFAVTSTEDSGAGTLRQAIQDANSNPGADVIIFQIPQLGTKVISLKSALPLINDALTIDGTSDVGYSDRPRIQIDGLQAGDTDGLVVAAQVCALKAICITRFQRSGILLINHSTLIEACYIGVEPDGVTAAGNGHDGITILSANNRIGREGARPNIISGNTLSGILITDVNATGNVIVNNYAGTNEDGDAAIPNKRWGVLVLNATDAVIGGPSLAARNVVSGNLEGGIGLRGLDTRRIVVQGNHVGIGADTALAIPNGKQGIEIGPAGGVAGTPSDVLIGGTLTSEEGNLICGNTGAGIGFYLDGVNGSNNVVAGNIIGLDGWTLSPVPNGHGIFIQNTVTPAGMYGVQCGGIRADSANIIAGNTGRGIWIYGAGAQNNVIRGNYVGIAPLNATTYLSRQNNDFGVVIEDAANNEFGGTDTLSGNVVCANAFGGIVLTGGGATGNIILNNYIGTAPGRPRDLGNGYNGVYLESGSSGNTIGRINAGNVIAHNQYAGIYAYSGMQNSLRGNSLYSNGTMGIDLGPGGITANDSLDLDAGANTLINFPIVESAKLKPDGTSITFTINGAPWKQYTVDFYTINSLSTSLFGEGDTLMGYYDVTTDANGVATSTILLDRKVTDWQHVTAMMTDADGNSSEFCRAVCWKDSDGDALLDCWETQGVGMDINMDGLMDLDLYSRGARLDHKDLFVEVDHMDSLEFSEPAREIARNFFLTAPNNLINNPDKKNGVNLHIDYNYADATIPPATWSDPPWDEFHVLEREYFGTEEERAHPNSEMLLKAKRRVYRYCIFGDQFDPEGSAGYAEDIPDNDFVVTLGAWTPRGGTIEQQAGTFVHELGHTLGLRHGGNDDINYKPNYISVMNYLWCMPRQDLEKFKLTWQMTYSPSKLDDLIEFGLDERKGLNIPEGLYQPGRFLFGDQTIGYSTGLIYPSTPVDWNNDGDSTDASGFYRELNGLDPDNAPNQRLTGFSDWPALIYDPQSSPSLPHPSPDLFPNSRVSTSRSQPDITPATYAAMQALPPYGFFPAHRVPFFVPRDTQTVGGNYGSVQIGVTVPAPAGGLSYYFRSSAPDLMTVDRMIQIPKDWSQVSVGFSTIGVEKDTTVYIFSDSLDIPLHAAITLHPASLVRFDAKGDSGCVVTELGGFKKRFLAGCTILLEATFDGQAPPAGGTIQLSSSRPDLIAPVATSPIGAFAVQGYIPVSTATTVSSPEMVVLTAVYRDSSRSDTVYIMPAPRYTFTQIGSGGTSGLSTLEINNAGDVLIEWAWIYKDGSSVAPSSYPGYRLVAITGMNDAGWISGAVYDSTNSHMVPAYWKPDTTIVLPCPYATYPYGSTTGINNNGDVLGFCEENAYPYRQKPILWKNDVATPLEEYADYWLETIDLNDAGQATGTGILNRYPRTQIGIRWDNSALTAIGYPFDTFNFVNGKAIAADGTVLFASDTYYFRHNGALDEGVPAPPPFTKMMAFDINDSLDVVGSVSKPVGEGYVSSAFVLTDGYQYDLSCVANFPAGWTNLIATSINNSGTIVGYGYYGGRKRYFMLTPGGSTRVGETEIRHQIPTEFRLFQNYPNPFNPTTTISYQIPHATDVQLEIFSLLGKRVRSLANGWQAAGSYEVRVDGTSLASGVYFYRLRAGQYIEKKKMLLLK